MNKLIASLLSALMALASLGIPVFAAPALKNYPDFLGVDGQLDAYIVVGADASVEDVVGAIDVALSLAIVSTQPVQVEAAGAVSVTGGVSLDTSTDRIHLGDAINTVKQTLTERDLPTILADGEFEDDDGETYPYSQYIDVGTATVEFVQEDSDEDPILEIEMGTDTTKPLYTLRVSFTEAVDFNDAKSEGNPIELFGTEFTVAEETDANKLVLYKSAETIVLNLEESATITIDGEDHTVTLVGCNPGTPAKAIVQVDEDVDDIAEGRSEKIGGVDIFAKTVLCWQEGAEGKAILQVGSEKVTLENGQEIVLGEDEEVEGTEVAFTGTVDSLSEIKIYVFAPSSDEDFLAAGATFEDPFAGTFKVAFDGVNIDLKADDRDEIRLRPSGDDKGYVRAPIAGEEATLYFVNKGYLQDSDGKNIYVVEGAQASEDEIIFLAPGDATYTHIVQVSRIEGDDDGNSDDYAEFKDLVTGDTYKTQVFNLDLGTANEKTTLIVDGKTYTVDFDPDGDDTLDVISVTYSDTPTVKTVVYPALETTNGALLALTDDISDVISLTAGSAGTGKDGGILALPTGDATITYDSDGSAVTAVYVNSNALTLGGSKSVQVGSVYYVFTCDASAATVTCDIAVEDDQTGSGNAETDPAVLLVEEEDDQDAENAILVASEYSSDVGFEKPVFTASTTWEDVGTSDDDVYAYLDYYGTYVERDTSDSSQATVTIWYPDEQVYARVAIGENPTWTTTVAGEEVKQYVPITQAVALLDTEVTDLHKQSNLILVGGPAINRLTADVYNLTYPTYGAQALAQNITYPVPEGKAIIEVLDSPYADGKVVVVVAGWEAGNTRAATSVLQRYETLLADIDASKVIVEGTSRETAAVTPA